MKSGDIVINIPNGFTVAFEGYIAGRVNAYIISNETGRETFTGTFEELLSHCANKVKAHNEHVRKFGGVLI